MSAEIKHSPRHEPQTWANMEYLATVSLEKGKEFACHELSAIWEENRLPPIERRHRQRAEFEMEKDRRRLPNPEQDERDRKFIACGERLFPKGGSASDETENIDDSSTNPLGIKILRPRRSENSPGNS